MPRPTNFCFPPSCFPPRPTWVADESLSLQIRVSRPFFDRQRPLTLEDDSSSPVSFRLFLALIASSSEFFLYPWQPPARGLSALTRGKDLPSFAPLALVFRSRSTRLSVRIRTFARFCSHVGVRDAITAPASPFLPGPPSEGTLVFPFVVDLAQPTWRTPFF